MERGRVNTIGRNIDRCRNMEGIKKKEEKERQHREVKKQKEKYEKEEPNDEKGKRWRYNTGKRRNNNKINERSCERQEKEKNRRLRIQYMKVEKKEMNVGSC